MSARRVALAFAILLAPAARAQDSGFALDLAGGWQDLTSAKNSAKAVFDGSSGGVTFGGGLRYSFGNGPFVGGFVRYFKKDGERVFVASATGEVFPLGHPLSVKLVPIQGTIGWRFGKGSLVPYVGGGAGLTSFSEESSVGGVSESAGETKFSAHALGGIEFGSGSFRVAAEAMWTIIPDSVGVGGVSQVYAETDLGGLSVVGKVVFAFGR